MTADLEELYAAEYTAFVDYSRAVRGDDGSSRTSAISPKRVRDKRKVWYDARDAMKAAGYTRHDVAAMLAQRGSAAAAKGRKR